MKPIRIVLALIAVVAIYLGVAFVFGAYGILQGQPLAIFPFIHVDCEQNERIEARICLISSLD